METGLRLQSLSDAVEVCPSETLHSRKVFFPDQEKGPVFCGRSDP